MSNGKRHQALLITSFIIRKQERKSRTKIQNDLTIPKDSYTHTSSKKYQIVVGQKYTYTVKAYNTKTKKAGSYNKKGLTVYTKPAMVKNIKAAYKDGIVTLTWDKAAGADKYLVYRKDNGKWKMLALKNSLSYEDAAYKKGEVNTYMVRGYYSGKKTKGSYDKDGVSVKVPADAAKPTEKPEPTRKAGDSNSYRDTISETYKGSRPNRGSEAYRKASDSYTDSYTEAGYPETYKGSGTY